MPDPIYRQATAADADAIAAAAGRIWDEAGEHCGLPGRITAEGVRGRLAEWGAKGAMFVCESDGVCGFASLQPDVNHPSDAIMGVWVLPEARGHGSGTELALMATEFARAAGYKKLRGTIPDGNESALSFFGEVGTLVQAVGQGLEYELPL